MSTRTIQRKLGAAGQSFAGLLTELRRQLATEYLANDELTRDRYRPDPFLGQGRMMSMVVIVVVAYVTLRRFDLERATLWVLGAGMIVTPTLHPWYLCWALPFLACFPSRAWTWLVALAPASYVLLVGWRLEGVWREPAWLWPLWVLPFLALGLRERLRRP